MMRQLQHEHLGEETRVTLKSREAAKPNFCKAGHFREQVPLLRRLPRPCSLQLHPADAFKFSALPFASIMLSKLRTGRYFQA
jgi:hypothetical protein